jgi:hypothetical protein
MSEFPIIKRKTAARSMAIGYTTTLRLGCSLTVVLIYFSKLLNSSENKINIKRKPM